MALTAEARAAWAEVLALARALHVALLRLPREERQRLHDTLALVEKLPAYAPARVRQKRLSDA